MRGGRNYEKWKSQIRGYEALANEEEESYAFALANANLERTSDLKLLRELLSRNLFEKSRINVQSALDWLTEVPGRVLTVTKRLDFQRLAYISLMIEKGILEPRSPKGLGKSARPRRLRMARILVMGANRREAKIRTASASPWLVNSALLPKKPPGR